MARKNRNTKQAPQATVTQPETAQVVETQVPRDAIAMRAHEIWKDEGCTIGHQAEHWFRAENELRAQLARKNDKN